MRIVTWNVNSVRSRLDRLLTWLTVHTPDIVCLQELKATDDAFPHDAVSSVGYFAAVHGQKTYNGVAILSKAYPTEVRAGFGPAFDDPQARLLTATIGDRKSVV
jgi:exodeoxyribonuclease-3